MERSTVQGITQDKIKKTNLGEFHLYTFQTNKIQVNSCLCLTWPISFRAFIVNSLPNSPVISTPPRLETVRSALLQSPSHVPLAGCWDNVSSKLLTLECLCVSCAPRSLSVWPVGPGHLLSCWPNREKHSHFSEHPSYSLLLQSWQEERLEDVFPVLRAWECCISWLAQELWPMVPVCDQATSQNSNQAQVLSPSMKYSSTNFSWLNRSSTDPSALQLRERFQYLQNSVQLTLPQRGVSCRKEQSFFRATNFPKFIGEPARTTCLEGSHLFGSCCTYISIRVCGLEWKQRWWLRCFFSRRSGFLLLWKDWYCSETLSVW